MKDQDPIKPHVFDPAIEREHMRAEAAALLIFAGSVLIATGVVCLSWYMSMYQTVGWIS